MILLTLALLLGSPQPPFHTLAEVEAATDMSIGPEAHARYFCLRGDVEGLGEVRETRVDGDRYSVSWFPMPDGTTAFAIYRLAKPDRWVWFGVVLENGKLKYTRSMSEADYDANWYDACDFWAHPNRGSF